MANQAFRVFMAILTVVLVDRANAYDPVKDQWDCKHNSGICVTSFKWCSRSNYSKGCSIPENANPYYNHLSSQETSFEFSFKELAEEFPTNTYDLGEVKGQAIKALNIFSISQPEKSSLMWDFSDQFSIIDSVAKPYMLTQRSDTPDKVTKQWKRGIGIGIGIGVLVLIIMAVVFWYLRKK
ncbi:hypothetical protein QQZ08_001682 [Neonectria magnoliae]|uniref:Uncharacterized protein n=1 Tax=Neonectria magnoliae TaxID=2732573 RepID=A0ABR1IDP1_9HYPO